MSTRTLTAFNFNPSALLRQAADKVQALVTHMRRHAAHKQGIHDLNCLDDRLLADIGLMRHEIRDAARGPLRR